MGAPSQFLVNIIIIRMSHNQNGIRSCTVYIHTSRHLHVNFLSQLRQPSVVFLSRKLSISSFPELLHHSAAVGQPDGGVPADLQRTRKHAERDVGARHSNSRGS